MPAVYLGLGSNIKPEENLRLGCTELENSFGAIVKSSVYRSKAYGFEGDDFLNMVVSLDTGQPPIEIQDRIEKIHRLAGRDRAAGAYSARTLDIDLLLYGDLVVDEPPIRLPRPDILRFGFVLGPLAEVAPELIHPATNQSIAAHWRKFDKGRHPVTRQDVIL
ncbi:MAG: 2-amino-4-hydroxy-6-hydroxymethyldihydropteridine diphosphokinase [Woeseia sp.]